MAMGSRTGKDPAMFTNDANDLASFTLPDPGANITMDILEQQQAKEQARLLHRFRELRQWQQKQQDQLMQQQQLQLEVLREEQLRVQMLIASQRGAQWGDGRVTRAEGFHKPSPLLMTPPHRARRGVGIGAELAKTIMTVSTDSGLVTSMGDTLEQPQDSLPKPIMYPVSPSNDEDKYTNPELFSNPGSQGDELQSLDEQCRYVDHTDGGSDASSDSFILPPVPPDPKLARLATLGHGGDNLSTSLITLQALLNNAAPNFLQQVLGLLPKEQQALLHERQQAVVEESASPTFSPVHNASIAQQPARAFSLTSAATEQPSLPATISSKSASQSEHHLQGHWEQPLLSDKHPFHQAQLFDRQPFHQPPLQQGQRTELRSGVSESSLQRHLMLPESQGQDSFRYRQEARVDEFAPRCKDLSPGTFQPPIPRKSNLQYQHKAQQQQRSLQQQAWQDGDKNPEEEKDEDPEESDEEELEVTVMAAASPDERPIKPGLQGKMTFEQLLEEQMASDQVVEQVEEEKEEKQEVHGSTKRPFLRKGEGIARFLKPVKKPPPKKSLSANQAQRANVPSRSGQAGAGSEEEKPSQQRKTQPRKQLDKKRVSKDTKKDNEDRPLPEMLKLIKRRSEGGRKVHGETKPEVHDRVPDHAAESSADTEDMDTIPDDASFIARLRERKKTEPAEVEELEEFELLEDVADNMSLVSNSSVVARLVTPNKQRQKTAVTNLKSYLAQKKMSATSPFERNAAIGSLMASSSLQMTVSQPKEKKTEMNSTEEQDKVKSECIRHERDSSSDTLTDSSTDEEPESKGISVQVKKTGRYDSDEGEKAGVTNGLCREVLTGAQERVSGMLFSKFSFFDQEKTCIPESEGSELKAAPSPTKSVTRKVATLQSRLAAANDTATLLQRLSAHAGFLTSKFTTEQNSLQAQEAAKDASQHDLSGISLNMPKPLLIGPKTTVETDHLNNRTSDSEEDSLTEQMDGRNEHDKAKNKYRRTGSDGGADAESGDDDDDDGCDGGDNANALLVNGSDAKSEGITDNADINQNNNNSNNVEFDDEEEWTSSAPQATNGVPTDGIDSLSTPPTSKLMSRLFPNLKPKLTKAQVQQQQRFQLASSAAMGDGVQSKVLRDKLAELEAEIERFRNENAGLEKLRREREEGLGKLKEEISRFEREKTEELKRLEEFKIQETKKLKQERKLFETYQKQVRAMPDKKEREEIDMLRTQLSELQEELKRKEGRWTSNVTRLKARISELETENTELREEIKILERKRLQWVQTQGAKNAQVPPSKPQRSSTPTEMDKGTVVNGHHTLDVSTAQPFKPKGHLTPSQPTTSLASEVVANGTGYAGKTSFVPVTQSSGGESVPRSQPATPSMIEGVSLSPMTGHEGESASILARQGSLPIPAERPGVDKGNRQYEEKQYPDGKVEHVYNNGSREVLFANGTRKEISSDGQYIVVSFFNGDIKQIFPDQRVVYYYAEAQTTHTTYPDKLEVLQFPNNQTEKHYPDGTKEIIFPDQTVKYLFPNGTEESIFQDGTIMRIDKNGERVLEFPNGQREVHTQHYKRREYPDGTVKTLHNDGRQETRYSTGRLRLKDKDGNILLDKMC